MRRAKVYRNDRFAGYLYESDERTYTFRYDPLYFEDDSAPPVSLTLPKVQNEYYSEFLFPFFFNMISEGVNRKLQCRQLKIDEKDFFGLLIHTAGYDGIGAVKVVADEE